MRLLSGERLCSQQRHREQCGETLFECAATHCETHLGLLHAQLDLDDAKPATSERAHPVGPATDIAEQIMPSDTVSLPAAAVFGTPMTQLPAQSVETLGRIPHFHQGRLQTLR